MKLLPALLMIVVLSVPFLLAAYAYRRSRRIARDGVRIEEIDVALAEPNIPADAVELTEEGMMLMERSGVKPCGGGIKTAKDLRAKGIRCADSGILRRSEELDGLVAGAGDIVAGHLNKVPAELGSPELMAVLLGLTLDADLKGRADAIGNRFVVLSRDIRRLDDGRIRLRNQGRAVLTLPPKDEWVEPHYNG